jgi:Fur family ferric uptake transcriptional regulator
VTEKEWPSGIKKTKQREAVLEILAHAAAPLSAQDIGMQLEKEEQAVWLSTVYRILEMFTEKGIAVRTSVPGSDMTYYELKSPTHRHYAVCVDCHKIVALDNCPMAEFEPQLSDGDFRVLGHRIEMYGYCKDCDRRNHTETEEQHEGHK